MVIHLLVLLGGSILAYVVGGLLFGYNVHADIFFDLSFVLLFFALGQCIYELGAKRAILYLLITSAIAFGIEVVGTNTGLPFGKYYGGSSRRKVLGVPIIVPLIWFAVSFVMIFAFIILVLLRSRERTDCTISLIQRRNTPDSIVTYVLLMIDGVVVNENLGNHLVTVIGLIAMCSFLVATIVFSRSRDKEVEGENIPRKLARNK